jgi:glucose-1-phosphate thymidylyltransferase
MAVVIFEDVHVPRLAPITNTRPAYTITCGGNRLLDMAVMFGQSVHAVTRPFMLPQQEAKYTEVSTGLPSSEESHLFINARMVPNPGALSQLHRGASSANEWAIIENGQLLAAKLKPKQPLAALNTSVSLEEWVGSEIPRVENTGGVFTLFDYPHEIVTYHQQLASTGIEFYAQRKQIPQAADGVFIADQQSFSPNISTNAKAGPVVVEKGAVIGPGSVLIGPILIGPNVIVREHSAIKDGTVLGESCRIGGEVEASIFEPFTNKQHYGFIGHSYVGSWINLGAGTCNSDLKNTYGEVRMSYQHDKVGTGQRLMGCILGDFVKSAINTSIFTGKLIGSFTNLYGYVTENVGPFVNYAKSLGSVSAITPDVVIAMQQRMYERRNVAQLDCDRQLIEQLFAATAALRPGLENRPPSI